MNYFNVQGTPWNSPYLRGMPAIGMGFPAMSYLSGFGAGMAHGWMRHAANGMNGGWGAFGPWGARAPREGQWNADKGSYTIGQSGRLEVKVGEGRADFKSQMQYRVNGGDWHTLTNSKDTGHTATIHAPPGSNVQFRIQTPDGNTLRAGSTRNVDGLDHGQVSKTSNGYRLGFEDQTTGSDRDFNDAVLQLRDPGRRRGW
jgi:Domain of unknown function (DUF4114)